MSSLGPLFIFLGIAFVVIGVLFAVGKGPLAKLPGDVSISRPGYTLYIPITSMILASIILTIIFLFIDH